MAAEQWDLILAGGGLANGLIALRLRERRPELRVLVLEAQDAPGGNHTWSFHHDDLTPDQHRWLAPLVSHRWQGYDVRFPQLVRGLERPYYSITSEQFAAVMHAALGENLRVNVPIASLSPTSVTLADGTCLTAGAVIDGRGYRPEPAVITGSQAFLGQEWTLRAPHGLTRPILMDADVAQGNGYRFVYTLPLSATRLLIEDTHYVDDSGPNAARARTHIRDYAARQGWILDEMLREEQGVLPITLAGRIDQFWRQRDGQPCSGLRAGLYHATTGYSLPDAAALAEIVAAQPDLRAPALFNAIRQFALASWRRQRFFRVLNRMLFLAGPPARRWTVMRRFYQLDDGLIARFYAGRLTVADRARVLIGKPPVPVGEALLAILKCTPRLRAHNNG